MSRNGDAHATDNLPPKTSKHLDLYFDIAGVILMAMDPKGRITLLNRKGCEIIGCEHDLIIGTSWFDYIPDRHKESVVANFGMLMSGELESIESYERPILTLKGEERIIRWHTNALKDEQGEIIGIISSGEDVTDRKIVEANLEKRTSELKERLKELVCLYETSRLLSSELSLNEIFESLVYLIQNTYQNPDLICARIRYTDAEYQTDNFRETEWNQHSTIVLNNIEIGQLDIFYLEYVSEEDGSPFLKEEQDLIEALAENVTIYLERITSDKKLQWELSFNRVIVELTNALITPGSNIASVSAKVLEYSRILTKSEYGFVASIDPLTLDLVSHTLSDMMGDPCKLPADSSKIVFPIGDDKTYSGLWGHSLNTRESFYTNSPQLHKSSSGIPPGHIPLRNFLSVPAIIGDELVGQIALANSESEFTDIDIDTITRLSTLYAVAISRMRIESTLQESEKRYRTLVQSMNDIVLVYDSENKYAQYYASDKSILISPPEDFIGKSISEVLPENVADNLQVIIQQVRDTGESMTLDYPLRINGYAKWFSAAISLHEDGVSIVSVVRDTSKRKELEEQREQHRKELELYSSLLHHDIGNDLQVIQGYLDMAEMESDKSGNPALEMLVPVKNATERMQNLLAILGSPREAIQTEMLQLVSKVAANAQKIHKGLSVRISVARGAQPLRIVSSRLLPMVFENLFRNSVQFCESDPIIDVEMSKSNGRIIVEVSDNGQGIPEDLRPKLFQRGISTTGSGLGLYLVKQILTAYNGSIELVDSSSGNGATFRITLPMAK